MYGWQFTNLDGKEILIFELWEKEKLVYPKTNPCSQVKGCHGLI